MWTRIIYDIWYGFISEENIKVDQNEQLVKDDERVT